MENLEKFDEISRLCIGGKCTSYKVTNCLLSRYNYILKISINDLLNWYIFCVAPVVTQSKCNPFHLR